MFCLQRDQSYDVDGVYSSWINDASSLRRFTLALPIFGFDTLHPSASAYLIFDRVNCSYVPTNCIPSLTMTCFSCNNLYMSLTSLVRTNVIYRQYRELNEPRSTTFQFQETRCKHDRVVTREQRRQYGTPEILLEFNDAGIVIGLNRLLSRCNFVDILLCELSNSGSAMFRVEL